MPAHPNQAIPTAGGRPRDPTIEARVLQAAREELAERGLAAFSVRQVAARAGVSRPSLLLRWPDWESLVIDALNDIEDLPPLADTGSLRGDLLAAADDLETLLHQPMLDLRSKLAGDASRFPALYASYQKKVMQPAGRRVREVFTRARSRGEVDEKLPVRWMIDALVGALSVRTLSNPGLKPPSRDERMELVDMLLRCATPHAARHKKNPAPSRRADIVNKGL